MLKEEEGGEGEEKIGGARRLRAVTAVAAGWQRWQALEVEVRYAADEVLRASGAWRAAEGRYEAAGEVAELAEERVREARFLVESARSGRHPRQAIAVRRLRCAAEEACRARLAANAAGDEAEEAADEYDAYDAGLGAAEDRADAARERLRVAEREAAWSRAVEVLARLRAARRRSHSVLEGERCVVCVEEHDVVLVVDEEEVFTVPEDPAGVPALQDDDLPPLLYISWCRVTNQVVSRVWVTSQVVAMPEEEPSVEKPEDYVDVAPAVIMTGAGEI